MEKKVTKNKKTNNNTKKKINNTKTTKQQTKSSAKTNQNIKIACILVCIAILLVCYTTLGMTFTIVAAIGMAIILGVVILLNKIKNQKKKKKIINMILITLLTIGILCLVLFSVFCIYIKVKADPKFKTANLNTPEISRIYDKDGNEYAKLGAEKRVTNCLFAKNSYPFSTT